MSTRLRQDTAEVGATFPRSPDRRHRLLPRRGGVRGDRAARHPGAVRRTRRRAIPCASGCRAAPPARKSIRWPSSSASRSRRRRADPKVQIFGTDIDESALQIARAAPLSRRPARERSAARGCNGSSSPTAAPSASPRTCATCACSPRTASFATRPSRGIDLISCRNLLIYLDGDLQARVIPAFHYALRPGGFLFLGSSENVTSHSDLFTPFDRKHRIFRRRDHVASPGHLPLFMPAPRIAAAAAGRTGRAVAGRSNFRQHDRRPRPRAVRPAACRRQSRRRRHPLLGAAGQISRAGGRPAQPADPGDGAPRAAARPAAALQEAIEKHRLVVARAHRHRARRPCPAARPHRRAAADHGAATLCSSSCSPTQAALQSKEPAGRGRERSDGGADGAGAARRPRAPAIDDRGVRDGARGAAIGERGAGLGQRGAAIDQRGAGDRQGGDPVGQRGAADGQPRAHQQGRGAQSGQQRPAEPLRGNADRHRLPRPSSRHPQLHARRDPDLQA